MGSSVQHGSSTNTGFKLRPGANLATAGLSLEKWSTICSGSLMPLNVWGERKKGGERLYSMYRIFFVLFLPFVPGPSWMSVAECAFSCSAPSSEEGKYRQHSRKCDYPRAAAGPEPDQWPLALWLTRSASGPLYILLKHSLGIHLYDHGQPAELY